MAPEDRVIIALTDESGSVVAIELLSPAGPNPPVTLSEDRTFFAFRLAPASFMTPDAVPLPDLSSMRVRTADRPSEPGFGGCGRCLAPFGRGPQPIYAGDSCPVPIFAEAEVFAHAPSGFAGIDVKSFDPQDPERIAVEAARRAIRIDFAGDCACSGGEPEPLAADLAFEPLAPAFSKEPIAAFGQAADGTAGLFSSRFVRIVAPDGSAVERVVPFGGPILAAGALEDRGIDTAFLVAADVGSSVETVASYSIARVTGASIEVSPLALPALEGLVARRMERLIVDGAVRLYVGGHHEDASGIAPALVACEGGPNPTCGPVHRIESCGAGEAEHGIVDIERLAAGLAVVTSRNRIAGIETASGQPVSSRCVDAATIGLPGKTLRYDAAQKLGALGGSLFVCGTIPTDYRMARPIGEVVIRADVSSPQDMASIDPAIVFERVISGRPEPNRCGDFFEERAGPEVRLAFTIKGGEYKRVSEDGTIELEDDLADVVGDETVHHLVSVTPSWRLLLGGTFVTDAVGVSRQTSRSADPVERIYGGTEPVDARRIYGAGLFIPSEGRFLAVSVYDERPMEWVDLDGTVQDADFPELYPMIDGDNVAAKLALDPSDGTLVVVGTVRGTQVGGNRPWIRRFRPGDGSFAGEVDLPETDKGPMKILELARGTLMYYDDAGNLYAIRGSSVRPVPTEFDDPFTAEVELLPELPSDDPFLERRPYQFDGGSSNGGVAWIVGTRGVVFRVVALPEGDPSGEYARAERFALSRVAGVADPIDVFEDFSGALASCPDRVALASRDHVVTTVTDGVDLALADVPGIRPTEHRREVRGEPLLALGEASVPIVVHGGGAILSGGEILGYAPFPGVLDAVVGEGRLLVLGRYARIGLGRLYLER
jgi:hypothetical protein